MIYRRKRSATTQNGAIPLGRYEKPGGQVYRPLSPLNQLGLTEKANDRWGWNWIEDFGKDLRQTTRLLNANRSFSVVTILTLALGIGTNTAIFSVTNALLLRTLPVKNAEQIYRVSCDGQPNRASNTGDSTTSFSYYVFQSLRTNQNAVSDLMAYVPLGRSKISVRSGTVPEEAAVHMVSGNFFTGLRAAPACGRTFTVYDESSLSRQSRNVLMPAK